MGVVAVGSPILAGQAVGMIESAPAFVARAWAWAASDPYSTIVGIARRDLKMGERLTLREMEWIDEQGEPAIVSRGMVEV